MRVPPPRRPRLKLNPAAYRNLVQEVLRRDNWHCQRCGRRHELEVHHLTRRSRQGDDMEANLITLCAACHRDAHSGSTDVSV